jgi:hypothetical protein
MVTLVQFLTFSWVINNLRNLFLEPNAKQPFGSSVINTSHESEIAKKSWKEDAGFFLFIVCSHDYHYS